MNPADTEDQMRSFARRLFDIPDEAADQTEEKPGNYVPTEGNNPRPPENDMRAFTAALFDRD